MMTRELEMKEGWMCAVYLHNMCKQVQIFPITCNRGLKLLVFKLKEQCNISQEESDEFTRIVESNLFFPDAEQIKCCVVFIEELSVYSDRGIENLFLEHAKQKIAEDKARLRNDKIDSLGI